MNQHQRQIFTSSLSLAVLSTQSQAPTSFGLAVCRFNAEVTDSGTSPRVQLMPDGYFKSHDGRPDDTELGAWLMDESAFNMLKVFADQRSNDFHFDYEHQTLNADDNGKEAPAAGWFNPKDLEYVPGEGLFALNVKWTDKAANYLRNDEYRYISPVFHYGKDGRPVKLRHFALTNEPAVDGMKQIAVLKGNADPSNSNPETTNPETNSGDTTMNQAQKLLALLGVTVEDGETPTDAQFETGMAALKTLQARANSVDGLTNQLNDANNQVAALKANTNAGGEVDLSKYVPVETYNAMAGQLAVLKSENDGLSIEQEIEKARSDGRIIAAETDYFNQLGQQKGIAVLKATLDARTPIAALSQQQADKTQDKNQQADPELTTEELAVLKATGIDKASFLKNKDAN